MLESLQGLREAVWLFGGISSHSFYFQDVQIEANEVCGEPTRSWKWVEVLQCVPSQARVVVVVA